MSEDDLRNSIEAPSVDRNGASQCDVVSSDAETSEEAQNNAVTTDAEAAEVIVTPKILELDYCYKKLLGEGSNGRTWLAKERNTAAEVAIKELKLAEDPKAVELFLREAEVLKSINVDGVPKFYKSIIQNAEIDTSYIIQEYINHPSLQDALDEGRIFTEDEVIKIVLAVANILQVLQMQYVPPIIHRDIKPANILFEFNSDGEVRVWLIDFGAVANPQKQSGGSTIAGTFGYMAPEQLQGEVAVQSDFYALGATALHLLTGVSPYDIDSKLFQLQYEPILAEKAPKAGAQIKAFLASTLASEISDRPPSANELIELIQSSTFVKRNAYSDLPFAKRMLKRWNDIFEPEVPVERWVHCVGHVYQYSVLYTKDGSKRLLEVTYEHEGIYYQAFLMVGNPAIRFLSACDMPDDVQRTSVNCIRVDCNPNHPGKYRFGFQCVWLSDELYRRAFLNNCVVSPDNLLKQALLSLEDCYWASLIHSFNNAKDNVMPEEANLKFMLDDLWTQDSNYLKKLNSWKKNSQTARKLLPCFLYPFLKPSLISNLLVEKIISYYAGFDEFNTDHNLVLHRLMMITANSKTRFTENRYYSDSERNYSHESIIATNKKIRDYDTLLRLSNSIYSIAASAEYKIKHVTSAIILTSISMPSFDITPNMIECKYYIKLIRKVMEKIVMSSEESLSML